MRGVACLGLIIVGGLVAAQSTDPYSADRARAVNNARLLPALPLAAADEMHQRAERARSAGRGAEAARLDRLARSLLPIAPPNLPPHVATILGDPRLRHADWVSAAAINADGTRLATGGRDRKVRIWDVATGRLVREYSGHGDWVRAVIYLPDGRVASAGGKEVHVWDPETGKLAKAITGATGYLKSIAAHPSKKIVLVGGEDRAVRAWDYETGQEAFSLGVMSAMVEELRWNATGSLAAVVTGDGNLFVWDITSPDRKKVVDQKVMTGGAAHGVAFLPDGRSVAVCGEKTTKFLALPQPGDPADVAGITRKSFDGAGGHRDLVTCLAITADGKTLATGSRDHTIRLWDVATGAVVRTLAGHGEDVTALCFTRDGKTLASTSIDQSVRLWDLEPTLPRATLAGHAGPVFSAAISPDGKRIATGGHDRTVRVWDATTGRETRKWANLGGVVTSIAWLGDGTLAAACGDKTIRLGSPDSAEPATSITVSAPSLVVAASPDGKRIAIGGVDRKVVFVDRAGGGAPVDGPAHGAAVMAIAWSPDGATLASGAADGVIKLWDVAGGREIGIWRAHDVGGATGVVFHPGGQQLFSAGGDRLVKTWKLPANSGAEPVQKFAGHAGPITALAMHSSGRWLASAGADTSVKVWDSQTAAEVTTFRGHAEWVTALSFIGSNQLLSADAAGTALIWPLESESPDLGSVGHTRRLSSLATTRGGFATGSFDRTAILWDLATGRPRRVFGPLPSYVTYVALSGDGAVLAAASAESRIRVWETATGKEIALLSPPERASMIALSPDGKQLIAWHLREGRDEGVKALVTQYRFDGSPTVDLIAEKGLNINCLAFSSDTSLAALGTGDGKLQIWSLRDKKRIGDERAAHDKPVMDVGIAGDYQRVVSVDETGEAKVWPLAGGAATATIKTEVTNLAGLVAGGARFAVYSLDGPLAVFDLDGKPVRKWNLETRPMTVGFIDDARRLAVGLGDGTTLILDLQ